MRSPHLERARLQGLQPVLQLRSRILTVIRTWFAQQGFIEVETPVRLPTPALELHIDAEPSGNAFLRTSPELHMKRLLAAGYDRIFQIGPCFRKGERGDRHNPEYTMLEWYRANADYQDIMNDTESLLRQFEIFNLKSNIPRLTVEELFLKHAGWNPVVAYDAERFEHDLVSKVEPALPRDKPVFVMDYPVSAAALSRRKPGRETVAERFELYINGVEIANAFSELTDPVEQRLRFETWARERKVLGAPVYPLDEDFLAALETGMPPSGGIALGIDRLVMVLADKTSLDNVMAFREH
ncbi:MAG: EF-P lysine aminoacylase EpmA [bacterium]